VGQLVEELWKLRGGWKGRGKEGRAAFKGIIPPKTRVHFPLSVFRTAVAGDGEGGGVRGEGEG
jgi:hypothetical protein